jgi:hypothetical protein
LDLIDLLVEVPTATIRQFARKSWHYMDAYGLKNGQHLSVKQVEYAVRKYKRHRCVPDAIWNEDRSYDMTSEMNSENVFGVWMIWILDQSDSEKIKWKNKKLRTHFSKISLAVLES